MGGNYSKDVFKQLQETMVAVEKLSAEIPNLKKNHKAEIETLNKKIDSQATEISALKSENQKLKDIISEPPRPKRRGIGLIPARQAARY